MMKGKVNANRLVVISRGISEWGEYICVWPVSRSCSLVFTAEEGVGGAEVPGEEGR